MVFHGLGVQADYRKLGPDQIRGLVEQVLADQTCRTNVKRMQRVFQEAERTRSAAGILESLLKKTEPAPC
jgi:UDP:flavonoid glycosyltransferase YjiC (YdhE family)